MPGRGARREPGERPVLNTSEVAKRYRMSVRTIQRAVRQGLFLQPRRLGPHSWVWDEATLDEWFSTVDFDELRLQIKASRGGRLPS
jgi:predicted DNA-binding transcriptional regulator AlpA